MSLYLIVSVLACALAALCIALFNRNSKAHSKSIAIFAYALTVYYGLTAIRLLMGVTPASKPLAFLLLFSGLYFCFKRGNVSDVFAAWAWPIKKLLNKEPHIEHSEHLTPAIPTFQPARIYRQRNRRPPQHRQQPARRAARQRDPHLRAIRKSAKAARQQSHHYY
jgi:energy-coupling factor transporter transmembrane protein EcfT